MFVTEEPQTQPSWDDIVEDYALKKYTIVKEVGDKMPYLMDFLPTTEVIHKLILRAT